MQHYPLSTQAFIAIHGSNTRDEAKEKIAMFYPRYESSDKTLLTPYDTAFKEAVSDKSPPPVGTYCMRKRQKVVIPDQPFTYSCLPHCAGQASAIEHLTA